jgi:hypothetical protein
MQFPEQKHIRPVASTACQIDSRSAWLRAREFRARRRSDQKILNSCYGRQGCALANGAADDSARGCGTAAHAHRCTSLQISLPPDPPASTWHSLPLCTIGALHVRIALGSTRPRERSYRLLKIWDISVRLAVLYNEIGTWTHTFTWLASLVNTEKRRSSLMFTRPSPYLPILRL